VPSSTITGGKIDLGAVEAAGLARHELLKTLVSEAQADLTRLMDGASYLSGRSRWKITGALLPLGYQEYRHAVGRFDSLRKELRQAWSQSEGRRLRDGSYDSTDAPLQELGPQLNRFVECFDRETYRPSPEGYWSYVGDVCPALLEKVARIEEEASLGASFAEGERVLHTHLLGGRGSGKSELLKLLVHHYVRHPELGGVVVIDPHNDLVRDISRWREFARDPERLVYLDGSLSQEHFPALNPLAVRGYSAGDKANFAGLMADAIGAFSATRNLTDNMRLLARNCLRVVLELEEPTLLDVARLLGNPENPHTAKLLERARRHPELGEWFSYRFHEQSLAASRAGLSDRLDNVLTLPRLGRMLKSGGALDLEAMCDAGKVVLIGLAGGDGGDELGRLMLARVAMIGWRRLLDRQRLRRPVNVFVDEAHRLIGPTALELLMELRKSGMRITLAHQALSQIENPAMRETLWNGAGVKIIGATDERDVLARLFGREPPAIPKYQFAVRWGMLSGDQVVMLTDPHQHVRGSANDMGADAYHDLMVFQLGRYYQPMTVRPASAEVAAPGWFGTLR